VLQKLYHKVSDSPKPINKNLPNHFIDVETAREAQHRALASHRSQISVWDTAARAFIENTARTNGKHLGVEYAEAFRRIVIEGALMITEGTKL
jgi:LmbE family N-acetylglucosaminyl deacetylase